MNYGKSLLTGKNLLLKMQQREIENTGIPTLKISFNNVFGYYIEVTKTHVSKVPDTWIRKQTLVNAERYITPELKEYEEKILGAEDRIQELESDIYNTLLAAAASYIKPIQLDARIISHIDALISFANIAITNNYHRPEINESFVIDIKGGRHPVIERQLPPGENYIANDLYLDNDKQQIIIITGPNMAGKSALLRQTALIVIMAQAGCFVPASIGKDRVCRQDFHPRRGIRQHLFGRIHLHGRDERGGQHPEQHFRSKSCIIRRTWTRHLHVRRYFHRLGHCRVFTRKPEKQGKNPFRHPLPRTERNGTHLLRKSRISTCR